jgi:hypothetical protein
LSSESRIHSIATRNPEQQVQTFQAGKTYATRSICDHNCIIGVTVAKRTAKTITTTAGKTLRVSVWQGVEQVKPWGTYSMAPIIDATEIQ